MREHTLLALALELPQRRRAASRISAADVAGDLDARILGIVRAHDLEHRAGPDDVTGSDEGIEGRGGHRRVIGDIVDLLGEAARNLALAHPYQ